MHLILSARHNISHSQVRHLLTLTMFTRCSYQPLLSPGFYILQSPTPLSCMKSSRYWLTVVKRAV